MSSINSHFTLNYSQPEEYRFSHDSVFLAREVFEYFQANEFLKNDLQVLDLCAGCGVIGLDFAFHCATQNKNHSMNIDFLEIQEIYKPHFQENTKRFRGKFPEAHYNFNFVNANYESLKQESHKEKYDLILSNPPYFLPGQGKMSPSEFKNRCRFFLDSDLKKLIEAIDNSLSPTGKAFILLRDLSDHGYNQLSEAKKHLSPKRKLKELQQIRGTPVALIDS